MRDEIVAGGRSTPALSASFAAAWRNRHDQRPGDDALPEWIEVQQVGAVGDAA